MVQTFVVFANYYREQARSLSHYESFRPYHEAFYFLALNENRLKEWEQTPAVVS